jgi:hypothetical protein
MIILPYNQVYEGQNARRDDAAHCLVYSNGDANDLHTDTRLMLA